MKIILDISEEDLRNSIDQAIFQAIKDHVEPRVVGFMKDTINDENVAKIIESRIRSTVAYGSYRQEDRMDSESVAALFDKRIVEISKRITDEELKNFLFEAIFNRVTNRNT